MQAIIFAVYVVVLSLLEYSLSRWEEIEAVSILETKQVSGATNPLNTLYTINAHAPIGE
jgi:hypothetical protein